MDYVFMTDSDSDLPYELKEQYDIPVVNMPYAVNGVEYFDDLGKTLDHKSYFEKMRQGAVPVTSALNEEAYLEYFEPILSKQDLLFVAFSSQLSCTIQAIYSAREKLLAKYPERKFIVVDTLSISGPMTLLILNAHKLYREGHPMEEVAAWIEENKCRAQAWFIVDDLIYLKRGGRISSTTAALGSMLDLKPVLSESIEGRMINVDKVRGTRRALNYLVERTVENIVDPAESIALVLHADAPEDAERLKALTTDKIPGLRIRIENIGPVIGAHCGPGTLAICFMGKKRPM